MFQELLDAALKAAAAGAFEDEEDNEGTGLALHLLFEVVDPVAAQLMLNLMQQSSQRSHMKDIRPELAR